jgi:putative N-acetylmannosamine-6-phosphate epimerase
MKIPKDKLKLYTSLHKLKPDVLSDVIQHLDENSIDDICECVYNVIHTDLSLSPRAKKKLKKHLKQKCSRKNLKIITMKKQPVSKRRKALSQEGQGIGLILGTVIPYLAKLIYDRANKK